MLANAHLNERQDVIIGYSRLFAGRFLRATSPGGDPDYLYAQYTFRW